MAQVQKRAVKAAAASAQTATVMPPAQTTQQAFDVDNMRTVNDIKTLRTLTGVANQVVYVKHHSIDYDNGGGFFMWRTSAELVNGNGYFTHDNNGTIIKATGNNTGRWIRQYDGYINLTFFGGYLNDATTALQAAIDFAWHNKEVNSPTKGTTVYIPQGSYMVNHIMLRNGVTILGDSQDSTILYAKLPEEGGTVNDYLFTIMPGALQLTVANLSLVGRDSNKGGFHLKGVLPDTGYPQAGVWNSLFKNIGISGFKDHALFLEGGDNGRTLNQFIVFEQVTIGLSTMAPATTSALKITGQQGQLTFINSTFNGYSNDMKYHTGRVVDISHVQTAATAVVSFINASFQEGDYGLYLDYAENATVSNCWFENLGVAVTIDGSWHECQGISILGNRFANAAGYGSLDVDNSNMQQGSCVNVINSRATIANNYVAVSQLDSNSSNDYFITATGNPGTINKGLEVYGNSYSMPQLSKTSGITQTASVTNGILNCAYNKLIVISEATTPVTTIESALNAGETIIIKAGAGSVVFQGGSTILLPNSGGLILNKGEVAGFTKLDVDGVTAYQLTSLIK